MKKLISVLTLVFTLVLSLGFLEVEAADPIIEVYPYNSLDCSLGNDNCDFAKVGRNNWTVTYNGYRYWVINDNTRYAHEFVDKNSDGYINPGDYSPLRYNAFGVLFINNTAAPVKLKGDAARADLTTVTHRIWSYYDENGVLQMLENQIHTTHMVNDNHGQEGQPANWRLATALEAEAYDAAAADAKPANMLNTHYRIKRVPKAQDADGYIMEPLKYIQWVHKDYDPDVAGSVKSTVVDHDPIEAHIPAGWSVLTFSTHDRGAYPPALNMVLSLPATFLDEVPKTAEIKYNDVAADFVGFTALDKNPYVSGVQVVAQFGEPFVLDAAGLQATYTRMYDNEGKVINERNVPIDFALEVSKGGIVLETINYTYNSGTKKYTASGPFTKVNTDKFEEMYDLKMKATTPKGVDGEVAGIIVVGVLPNRFEGVGNKIIRDGEYIDLMAGVKAYNGNGVDITNDVVVSWPDGFNPHNPQPGKYTITLDVAYEYHWAPVLTDMVKTTVVEYEFKFEDITDPLKPIQKSVNMVKSARYNKAFNTTVSTDLTYINFTNKALVAQTAGIAMGSAAAVVKAGKVVRVWQGLGSYTVKKADGTSQTFGSAALLEADIKAYELAADEYMLLAHANPEAGNLAASWGQQVTDKRIETPQYSQSGFRLVFTNVTDPANPVLRGVNVVRYPSKYNVRFNKEASALLTYIDYEHRDLVAQTAGMAWGSVAGVVRDGKLISTWNGFTSYTEKKPDGTTVAHANGEAMQNSIKAFEMQPGDYMILAHGSEEGNNIRYGWGDYVSLEGRPDFYYTAEAQIQFQVTVDDRTAPQVRVVNSNYQVDPSMFATADEAILANIVAFDNHSAIDLIISDDGGLDLKVPGKYTVVVDAEDVALNKTTVTFTVTVLAPKLSDAEVAALLEEQAADFQEVIDAQETLITNQQQALEDLETQIAADNATKEELAAAKAEAAAAAAAAQQAAQNAANAAAAAQTTANDNATQITAVDDAKLGTGANIGLMILFALVGAAISFGASFLVFGRKK